MPACCAGEITLGLTVFLPGPSIADPGVSMVRRAAPSCSALRRGGRHAAIQQVRFGTVTRPMATAWRLPARGPTTTMARP